MLSRWRNGAAGDRASAGTLVTEYPAAGDPVVMLHGLGRTRRCFRPLALRLQAAGFHALVVGYPSRSLTLEEAAGRHLAPAVAALLQRQNRPVHFVTHSMGGIVLREFLRENDLRERAGRAVLLGPPNQGSEVVDLIGGWWPLKRILGPAAGQLRTSADSYIHRLGPAPLELGVLMGDLALIPFFRGLLGPSDGIVRVEGGRIDGMRDFLVLPVDHTTMMWRDPVMEQVEEFLRHGRFRQRA